MTAFDTLGAWLRKDALPNYTVGARHKIATYWLDPTSGNAKSVAADIRSRGMTPALYYAPNWFPGLTPRAHAQRLSDFVQKDGIVVRGEPVMVDLELISVPWQIEFLAAVHSHLPSRPMAYTNGPFQNQTVVPTLTLSSFGYHWYPQLYYGPTATTPDMAPADPAAVMLEVARIYDPRLVHPFYDGAALPHDARDGCVFTADRLL